MGDLEPATVVEQRTALPLFHGVPAAQLEWCVRRGDLRQLTTGTTVVEAGAPLDEMLILLSGRLASFTERQGWWRQVDQVWAGKVVGPIPSSRLSIAPSRLLVEDDAVAFVMHRRHFPALTSECPDVTESLVHHMLDRVRDRRTAELNDDRLQSLGRLASGHSRSPGTDIVRRIVHMHHGDVDFTSQAGRTVFRVRLPLARRSAT